jgi:hypothetical protein
MTSGSKSLLIWSIKLLIMFMASFIMDIPLNHFRAWSNEPIWYIKTRTSWVKWNFMVHKIKLGPEFYSSSLTLIIIIIMALQPFVGPWPLFQFLDPIYSR